MEEQAILIKPINMLDFSQEFITLSGKMGFETLADVLATGRAELLKKENFSYGWLGELTRFLNRHKLTHLLQPIPGSTPD